MWEKNDSVPQCLPVIASLAIRLFNAAHSPIIIIIITLSPISFISPTTMTRISKLPTLGSPNDAPGPPASPRSVGHPGTWHRKFWKAPLTTRRPTCGPWELLCTSCWADILPLLSKIKGNCSARSAKASLNFTKVRIPLCVVVDVCAWGWLRRVCVCLYLSNMTWNTVRSKSFFLSLMLTH